MDLLFPFLFSLFFGADLAELVTVLCHFFFGLENFCTALAVVVSAS